MDTTLKHLALPRSTMAQVSPASPSFRLPAGAGVRLTVASMETALTLVLRRASTSDGHLLYRWRTDPVTRASSHQSGPIDMATHLAWLDAALSNPRREIYIAEADGVPVGTVRVDREADACEVSWTVAQEARGRGVGSRMVAIAAASIPGAIRRKSSPATRHLFGLPRRQACGSIGKTAASSTSDAGLWQMSGNHPSVRETHGMAGQLAINGGTPVRSSMLRYAGQSLDDDDIRAVEPFCEATG